MNTQSLHDPHPQSVAQHMQQPAPSSALPQPAPPLPPSSATDNIIGLLGFLPSSWQGSDESLRHALSYRAEEERRRAEEERTKQEESRLELRKKDLELLREGIRYGIPPSMMPFIFIGNGVTGATAEWIRDYVARIWQQQQHEIAAAQAQSAAQNQAAAAAVPIVDSRSYHQQHHRSQSAQTLPSIAQGLVPPPPPPPAPSVSAPVLPSLATSHAPPHVGSAFSPQEMSPGTQQQHHPIYQQHRAQGSSVTPPLQVRQIEFPSGPSKPAQPYRSPPPNVRSPSPPSQQPTIQFHHWQPHNSSTPKDKNARDGPASAVSSGGPAAPTGGPIPNLGNGIPRSPTRSILNPTPEDNSGSTVSPKRRRQTAVFETGSAKPTQQLSAVTTPRSNSNSPTLNHPSLPPISSLSSGPSSRKRGLGHARHRSEAALHGYEPYARPSSQIGGPQILNSSAFNAQAIPRGGHHRRTESSWEAGSVGVLAAAAESEMKKEMMALREKTAAERAQE